MPGRYEMFQEPEGLEIIDTDDQVYHPDQSVPHTSPSVRSLEPLITGPVTLRMIFFDPRWSARQQKCCVFISAFIAAVLFLLLMGMLVGLGRVLGFIGYMDRVKETGLHLFPKPEGHTINVRYCTSPQTCQANDTVMEFVNSINDTLKAYLNQLPAAVNCSSGQKPPPGTVCKFHLDWLGSDCTREKYFGYFQGRPCVLLQLRNIKYWNASREEVHVPKMNPDVVDKEHVPVRCSVRGDFSIPYAMYPAAGFNMSFIPMPEKVVSEYRAPLVMVQFLQPQKFPQPMEVVCRIYSANLDELEGLHEVQFRLLTPDQISEDIPY